MNHFCKDCMYLKKKICNRFDLTPEEIEILNLCEWLKEWRQGS